MDKSEPIVCAGHRAYEGVCVGVLICLSETREKERDGEEWKGRYPGPESLRKELKSCAYEEETAQAEEFGEVGVGDGGEEPAEEVGEVSVWVNVDLCCILGVCKCWLTRPRSGMCRCGNLGGCTGAKRPYFHHLFQQRRKRNQHLITSSGAA